ncbi:hypothetical protein ACFW04_009240 [Cataglyphis niger]
MILNKLIKCNDHAESSSFMTRTAPRSFPSRRRTKGRWYKAKDDDRERARESERERERERKREREREKRIPYRQWRSVRVTGTGRASRIELFFLNRPRRV